jgi:large subunit ribosomal protein L17
MRHRKSGRKLKRTASHRKALLANLSTSLLRHKRITTTVAKAKETRMLVEKLITRARRAFAHKDAPGISVHERRIVARTIRERDVVAELFTTIAEKVGARPGGYTRIVKLGQRQGDGAELAVIELVDFNTGKETPEKAAAEKKKGEKAKAEKKKSEAKKSEAKKSGGKKGGKEPAGEKVAKKAPKKPAGGKSETPAATPEESR